MALERIWDIAYEVDGETVRVEQSSGTGEAYAVDLHSIHVRLLAGELGLLNGDPDAWRRIATLERRLRVLHDRIEALDERLLSVPVFPPSRRDPRDDDPDLMFSGLTLDLAREFVADLPNLDDEGQAATTERHETPRNAASAQRPRIPEQPSLNLGDGQ